MRLFMILLLCGCACAEMLQYCDNVPSLDWLLTGTGRYGVRMTPSFSEGYIEDVSIYVCLSEFHGDYYHLKISLWRFNGTIPHDMFYEHEFIGNPYYVNQWRNFAVGAHWLGDGETEFVVSIQIVPSGSTNPTRCCFRMDDQFMLPNRNWYMQVGYPWSQLLNGDILVKTHFCCSNPVETSSIGSIKAAFAQ